jgi:hypothetical protein
MIATFGNTPNKYNSSIEEKDQNHLDVTDLVDVICIIKYQSLIGALQLLVTLGHYDILVSVTAKTSYCVTP